MRTGNAGLDGRRKLHRRDRPWVDAYVTVLCGPFDMPTTESLREAVAALAGRYPDSRLTWSIDPTGTFWRDDRTAASVVVERDWDDSVDVGERLGDLARDDSLPSPLCLIRYPRHIGLKMSHAVGDGRLFLTIITAVLQTALTGTVAEWPLVPSGKLPFAIALAATFGRRPPLIKAAMDDRIVPAAERASTGPRPWTPSRRTSHVSLPRQQADDIFAWGKWSAPAASRFAIQVALVMKALQAANLRYSTDVRVIVDLRRYLGWKYIDGNFVSGVAMNIGPEMDPEQISRNIKTTNASGRPLLGQILALRAAGSRPEPPGAVEVGALPRVTFTNMGRSPEIDSLPFLSDPPTVYGGSVPPEGPLGVTVLTGETSRLMTIDITYHDNVVDRAVIEEALRLAASDPIALLSGLRSGDG